MGGMEKRNGRRREKGCFIIEEKRITDQIRSETLKSSTQESKLQGLNLAPVGCARVTASRNRAAAENRSQQHKWS